jgi:hypothetical protein
MYKNLIKALEEDVKPNDRHKFPPKTLDDSVKKGDIVQMFKMSNYSYLLKNTAWMSRQ